MPSTTAPDRTLIRQPASSGRGLSDADGVVVTGAHAASPRLPHRGRRQTIVDPYRGHHLAARWPPTWCSSAATVVSALPPLPTPPRGNAKLAVQAAVSNRRAPRYIPADTRTSVSRPRARRGAPRCRGLPSCRDGGRARRCFCRRGTATSRSRSTAARNSTGTAAVAPSLRPRRRAVEATPTSDEACFASTSPRPERTCSSLSTMRSGDIPRPVTWSTFLSPPHAGAAVEALRARGFFFGRCCGYPTATSSWLQRLDPNRRPAPGLATTARGALWPSFTIDRVETVQA